MAINETGELASGVVMDCPSVEALRERLEELGTAVFYAEEATDEQVAEARRNGAK